MGEERDTMERESSAAQDTEMSRDEEFDDDGRPRRTGIFLSLPSLFCEFRDENRQV